MNILEEFLLELQMVSPISFVDSVNCQIMKITLAKLDLCLSCGYNTIFIYGTFIIIFHLRKLILRELDLADLERKLLHNLLTIYFLDKNHCTLLVLINFCLV